MLSSAKATTAFLSGEKMPLFDRITQDAALMGGKAGIRGMRVTVGMIVGQIGADHTIEEILADYPYIEREDVLQALRYTEGNRKIGIGRNGNGKSGRNRRVVLPRS